MLNFNLIKNIDALLIIERVLISEVGKRGEKWRIHFLAPY